MTNSISHKASIMQLLIMQRNPSPSHSGHSNIHCIHPKDYFFTYSIMQCLSLPVGQPISRPPPPGPLITDKKKSCYSQLLTQQYRKLLRRKLSEKGGDVRPPLWSSGQSFWLQIQRSTRFFWVVVGLERGLLSLVSLVRSTEELLE